MKKLIIVIVIILLINTISWAVSGQRIVAEVIEREEIEGIMEKEILKVKILEGKYKEHIITIDRERIQYSPYDFPLNIGDKILMDLFIDDKGTLTGNFINIWRIDKIKNLALIFIVMMILFGGLKGILSLTSLLFSGYVIITFMIPTILKGYNIIFISIISSSIIIITSFILISGLTRKSIVSIVGTVGGTIIAGSFAYAYSQLAVITGLADENVMFLVTNIGAEIDFSSLYMSSILIGTIGVVMDVSMSITSSMFEIKKQSPRMKNRDLILSGLKIGKDIMSTMVNTIILAYAGSSMPLLIINFLSSNQFIYTINNEVLAMEIIRSLCSSIGLVMTIPLTVFIAAYAVKDKRYI